MVARRYTESHEWVSVSNGIGTFGITGKLYLLYIYNLFIYLIAIIQPSFLTLDYAQKALGDVVFIEIPTVQSQIKQKAQIGAVESGY
jgi:glycine cleavage system H protein